MINFTKEDVSSLFTKRDVNAHKGTFGYVGVMGGCREYSGAVKLANMAQAALKSGCGVSRLIVPESIIDYVGPYVLESTLCSVPSDSDGRMVYDNSAIENAVKGLASLALGMGWGKSDKYKEILNFVLKNCEMKLVIDADAINMLSEMELEAFDLYGQKVITPHPKEFSRISGFSMEDIKAKPDELAAKFAKEHNCIVLLKGATTVITDGENVIHTSTGCPGMATAGSGDVLSGILAGLLGFLPMDVKTVAAGAYIAGLAGEMASDECGEVSMTAGDTVSMISKAISKL